MLKIVAPLFVTAILAVPAGAQNNQMRASIRGGGNFNEGKCTIEVVVDGAADVEIRGDVGTIRNLSGQRPFWRRFECSSRLPDRPAQFRFRGIDGRGHVELVRDPRNGGPAVVRIEDRSGGSEGYTFDLEWGGRFDGGGPGGPGGPIPGGPGPGGPFSAERAVRFCEQAIRQQAAERYGMPNIDFRGTRIDDNPGRRDWVIGTFSVRRPGRDDVHQFSCSVDLGDGQVRSARIDNAGGPGPGPGGGGGNVRDAVQICRVAVDQKIRRSGYDSVAIGNIRIDDNPGRNDWVIGNARGERNRRSDSFNFSCQVNLNSGNVRSVDVTRR